MASSYEYKESYSSNTTTSTATSSSDRKCCNSDVVFDKRYLKGIPGIIKYVEIVASLVAYICVEVPATDCGNGASIGYFKVISLFCFAVAIILWGFLLFKLEVRLCRCDCINWVVIEMVIYVVVVVLLFFADLFLSLNSCDVGYKAGVFFGWLAFGAFCLDLIYMVYNFCRGRTTTLQTTESNSAAATTTTTTPAPEKGKY